MLSEHASGYAIFRCEGAEDIGALLPEVQEAVLDFARFGSMLTLEAFAPFKSGAHALENINCISEGNLQKVPSMSGRPSFFRVTLYQFIRQLRCLTEVATLDNANAWAMIIPMEFPLELGSRVKSLNIIISITGLVHNDLQVFLMNNVPKKKKKSAYVLGVADPKLGATIQETLDIPCTSGEAVNFRWVWYLTW